MSTRAVGAARRTRSSSGDDSPPPTPCAGTLQVHVLGNWLFPRSVFGSFTIVCVMLRQLHLVASFLLSCLLFHLSSLPLLSLLVIPLDHPFASSLDWSPRRQTEPFDVIVVDQLSLAVPLLRWFGQNRVVFYCHFPDLLLSPSSSASARNLPTTPRDPRAGQPFSFAGELRKTYRAHRRDGDGHDGRGRQDPRQLGVHRERV